MSDEDTSKSYYSTGNEIKGVQSRGLANIIPGYANGWNKNRECDIWIGKDFKDWRKHNRIKVDVNDNVPLILDDTSFSISYSNNFASGDDVVPSSVQGNIDKATDFLEAAGYMAGSAGLIDPKGSVQRASKYDNPKVWESTSPIKFEGDLAFTFTFGCAGLFDAFEEVVKPTYVLASIFAPREGDGGGITPPLPSKAIWGAQYIASAISSAMGSLHNMSDYISDVLTTEKEVKKQKKDTGKNKPSRASGTPPTGGPYPTNGNANPDEMGAGYDDTAYEDEETETVTTVAGVTDFDLSQLGNMDTFSKALTPIYDIAVDVQNAYFQAIHAGAAAVLNSGDYNGNAIAYMRIGNFQFGPFTVEGASIDFDSTMLDENGYPYKGTVTLTGIEFYTTATDKQLWRTVKKPEDTTYTEEPIDSFDKK